MYFYLTGLIILLSDQLLKLLVNRLMFLGQSVAVIKGVVNLTYVRNSGAAFSLFIGFSPYLIAVALIVVGVVIYLHHKILPQNYLVQTALAFIFGGSLGNLLDRILRGYVIDYIDFGFWPVFNLADIMINIGVLLFIVTFFKGEKNASHSS